ncbi:AraC family transcriptional regulator [Paenibacillus thalictri]|uniref:Helix-turn-helix domain-containing protein n=1 Tax=Paenibacillus thalictri TaxID=2527873 RepID=A0A4Q9DH31_9BACL|nr:helix-turn-helix domain-containing protein [Paenibacillus thalictri]TBL71599.1 helix-turn-helix domain-containing protein [Paenibacillus thalictri]
MMKMMLYKQVRMIGNPQQSEQKSYTTGGAAVRKEQMELDSEFPVDMARRTISFNTVSKHWHPFLELGYCISGEGWFHIQETTYPVRAGDVFMINQSQPHIANCDPGKTCQYVFIYFRPSILEAIEPELLLPFNSKSFVVRNRIPGELPIASSIGRLICQMGEELEQRQIGYRSQVRGGLLQSCALLARYYRSLMSDKEWSVTLASFNRIFPALQYVKDHFKDNIRLEDVAEHIALSPSRTYHLFKEIIGDGFKEYVIKMRVKEAQRLLIGTDLPVTEVYLKSGFPNHASFYRSFHQFVKMTPREYRDGSALTADFMNIP